MGPSAKPIHGDRVFDTRLGRPRAGPERLQALDNEPGLLKQFPTSRDYRGFTGFDPSARNSPLIRADPRMLVTMLHQQCAIPVDQQNSSRSVVSHQGTVHARRATFPDSCKGPATLGPGSVEGGRRPSPQATRSALDGFRPTPDNREAGMSYP